MIGTLVRSIKAFKLNNLIGKDILQVTDVMAFHDPISGILLQASDKVNASF